MKGVSTGLKMIVGFINILHRRRFFILRSFLLFMSLTVIAVCLSKPYLTRNKKTRAHNMKGFRRTNAYLTITWYRPYHEILTSHIENVNMSACLFANCKLQIRKSPPKDKDNVFRVVSDAVLIQGNNIASGSIQRRSNDQVLVFVGFEPPTYIHSEVYQSNKWDHVFNWTMSYRQDSDILYPYGSIIKRSHADHLVRNYSAVFHRKTKSVAWIVSHCVTDSRREEYVRELSKYINVDIYGSCGSLGRSSCSLFETQECMKTIEGAYKFYLAFENSLCEDYVTEKTYDWFNLDIILITRGPRNYTRYLPKGTYIASEDFGSAKTLAEFILELGSREDKYVHILQVKEQYRARRAHAMAQRGYCRLCEMLNNIDIFRKSYKSISQWWSAEGICRKPTDIV